MARVLFLFNHDSPHQVAHLAGVAETMALRHPQVEVAVAFGNRAIRERLGQLIGPTSSRIDWQLLTMPPLADQLAGALDRLLPASRLLRLANNTDLFEQADILVSPERTCLQVKRFIRPERMPQFAMLPHGAGDRNVSYHPDFQKFDLLLVAGEKVVDQLVDHGVDRLKIRIVGYPKFETIDLGARPKFFDNDRPTFVYNPHFDPHLSSWYDAGPDLLRWFAGSDGQQFNLIFAPHVMLFRKTLHVSPEYRKMRRRPAVPPEALAARNILVDVNSGRLFDMSYMLGSDAYIGDASSQIYEFIARPRPAFFLDCRTRSRERDNDKHLFLRLGPVARSAQELVPMLSNHESIGERYSESQKELFRYTFSLGDRSASERAADAIIETLNKGSAHPTP